MARPGLVRHRKFLRLARALGSEALAIGHLELLWQASYETGDDYLGDMADVEAVALWRGEPGALCKAMLEAGGVDQPGFIDAIPDKPGCYRVHDLYDHAPEYVRKRLDRESARKSTGQSLRDVRSKAACKRWDKAKQTDANDSTVASVCNANGTTPSRTHPHPTQQEQPSVGAAAPQQLALVPDEPKAKRERKKSKAEELASELTAIRRECLPMAPDDVSVKQPKLNERMGAAISAIGYEGVKRAWMAYLRSDFGTRTTPQFSLEPFLAESVWRRAYAEAERGARPAQSKQNDVPREPESTPVTADELDPKSPNYLYR